MSRFPNKPPYLTNEIRKKFDIDAYTEGILALSDIGYTIHNLTEALKIINNVKQQREQNQQAQINMVNEPEANNTLPGNPYTPQQPTPSVQETKTFDTGATRCKSESEGLRFDLISPVAIRRLAAAYGEGAKKYSAYNCENGFPIFGEESLWQHLQEHLLNYLWGDKSEDHLGHALWNLVMIIHSEECWPELNAGQHRVDTVPPEKRMDLRDRKKLVDNIDKLAAKIEKLKTPQATQDINQTFLDQAKQIYGMSDDEWKAYKDRMIQNQPPQLQSLDERITKIESSISGIFDILKSQAKNFRTHP